MAGSWVGFFGRLDFLFPFVNTHRNCKRCVVVLQIRSSPHFSRLVFLLSLGVFVDMIILGSHSAASLVRLSELWVAIRKA